MNITFLSRNPSAGFSLENVFTRLEKTLSSKSTGETKTVCLPYITQGLKTVWQNLRFVTKLNLPDGIVHITGDVHYVALVTPPSQTVLTVADCVILDRNKNHPLRFAVFWLLYYYLPIRRTKRITAISHKTKRELQYYLRSLANKVEVVPCFYDPEFTFSPKIFAADHPTLLHIGTAPHKNLSRLISAVTGLSCHLVIVGALSENTLSELHKSCVVYSQFQNLSKSQIVNLYRECDIVTFVSLYEGFGLPILEAQATGRPVLTSNISPMTDVGGTGACYVDPTDVADIRRGVLRIWQDEIYRTELIKAGQENVRNYTLENVTAQYTTVYKSLINE
jgi:glycosyltransferase involved in cell wall biosynthesis